MEFALPLPLLLGTGEKRQNLLKKFLNLMSHIIQVNEDEASYLESKFSCWSQRSCIWDKHFTKLEFECKNSLLTLFLYLLSSKWLIWEVLHKFNEAITLEPICPNLYFRYKTLKRYTNGDLEICQYLHLHMKIICWRFHIKTPFTFWDMCTWDMWKVCLQTFRNRIC